ncbi:hypothetical protein OAK09_01955 [Candidatus Marinimicrobia bacterium]|nr:hypothetical protein [Candidatus Neomarinimicrobiota bacterium]
MFKVKYLPYLIVLITFCSDPFIWYTAFGLNDRIMSVLLMSFSFIYLIKKQVFMGHRDYLWIGSWILVFLYINIHGSLLIDTTQIVQSYGYLFKMLFLVVVIYAVKNDFQKLLHFFFKVNIVIIYASVVLFFLLILGIELPSIEFSQGTSGVLLDSNRLYPLGVVMDKAHFGNITFIRIGGLTDEPGQLALLITWLLILNEFTLKSKSYRKSLIFCGIFTFSLAFLVSIILFGIYFLVVKLNRPVLILKNVALLLISIFIVYSLLGDTPRTYLNNKIFSRLVVTSNQGTLIAGDNRTGSYKHDYERLKSIDHLWFGLGVSEAQRKGFGNEFATYGLISYFTRYIPIFLLLILNSKSIKIGLLLIITVNFLQRTGIHFSYQMLILTFIYYAPILRNYTLFDSLKRQSLVAP